jgi:glycosyltransferase involved in cell wall biosynthesis
VLVDLVAPYWRPVTGGIEDHVAALAQRILARGHEAAVHTQDRDLAGDPLPPKDEVDGVAVYRWPVAARLGYYACLFRPRLAGRLVHMHAYGVWTNDWIARKYERPKVLTLHHGLEIPTPTPIHSAYHWSYDRTVGHRTLRRIDRLISVTPVDVQRLEKLGYPHDRVSLIPNGVPESAFGATAPEAPPEGLDAYILYVGRLHQEKSVDHAIHAVSRLPREVGLVVAGPDQGDRERLEALAGRLGIAQRVAFLGRVGEDRKRALLAGARCLVLPSKYEAQGRVILEAWAQGTPVVAASVGGVPYVVDDGKNGILHAWGDVGALARALGDLVEAPKTAEKLGASGREKAHAVYLEEKLLDETVDVYEKLVGNAAPAASQ